MIKPACGQTTIPQVDNSEQPCEQYIPTTCVIADTAYPFVEIVEGDSGNDVIEKLLAKIKIQANQLTILQNTVNQLTGASGGVIVPEVVSATWSLPTSINIIEYPSFYALNGIATVINQNIVSVIKFPPLSLADVIPFYKAIVSRGGNLIDVYLVVSSGGDIIILDNTSSNFILENGDLLIINTILPKS